MIAPPVLALQAALTYFFPSKHPLAEAVAANPSPAMLWSTALAAVIAAPIAEEILFRLLLIGWLERMAALPHHAAAWLLGRSGEGAMDTGRSLDEAGAGTVGRRAMPLVLSAGVFAAMHLGHGPDAIPLFFFALGLGHLYQRTGSVVPCIVAHLLLNASSMVVLWLKISAAKA
jgi:membrane protease YdiL (CAAX protease family)